MANKKEDKIHYLPAGGNHELHVEGNSMLKPDYHHAGDDDACDDDDYKDDFCEVYRDDVQTSCVASVSRLPPGKSHIEDTDKINRFQ